jgi:hypothetical protein
MFCSHYCLRADEHREAGDFTVYKGAPGMAMMCMRLACTPELDADAKLLFLRMGQEYLQVHLHCTAVPLPYYTLYRCPLVYGVTHC